MTIFIPPEQAAALATKGRAVNSEQKRAVIERILSAWEKKPALRLGQLLVNASDLGLTESEPGIPLFFAEDDWLVEACEKFGGDQ